MRDRCALRSLLTRLGLLAVSLFFAFPGVVHAEASARCQARIDRIAPRDDALIDPTFARFREDLLAIAARRDTEAFFRLLRTDVVWSLGDVESKTVFRWEWDQASEERRDRMWEAMQELLRLGGAMSRAETAFDAPYVAALWPEDRDVFSNIVVLGRDVALRAKPSRDAPLVARLRHEVVEVRYYNAPPGWIAIRTDCGDRGFVRTGEVRRATDYRMRFVKGPRGWRIAAFVQGE